MQPQECQAGPPADQLGVHPADQQHTGHERADGQGDEDLTVRRPVQGKTGIPGPKGELTGDDE